jgi:hypothetical protein
MMKKIFGLAAISLLVAVSSPSHAQTTVEKAGHGVKSGQRKPVKALKKALKRLLMKLPNWPQKENRKLLTRNRMNG